MGKADPQAGNKSKTCIQAVDFFRCVAVGKDLAVGRDVAIHEDLAVGKVISRIDSCRFLPRMITANEYNFLSGKTLNKGSIAVSLH